MAVRLDDVRLVAVIGAELLAPPHTGTWPQELVTRSLRVRQANRDAVRDWLPSPYAGPLDVFGRPPVAALPVTAVQRTHECRADGHLVSALRELIG
jgi:hypothetical protein